MTRLACILGFLALALTISGIVGEPSPSKTEWKTCENGAKCVCYDDIGCFDARAECGEKVDDSANDQAIYAQLPNSPSDIGTTFLLYDKENDDFATELIREDIRDVKYLENLKFNTSRDTKFLIHGMISPNYYGLLEHIKEKLFDKGFNIIMVNWFAGNDLGSVIPGKIYLTYRLLAQSARVVGKQTGMFIEKLIDIKALSQSNVHVIGHNIGGHIGGYAGKHVFESTKKKIARITALAPASPYFEVDGQLKPAICRLDKEDADFVDAIHSDVPKQTKGDPKDEKVTVGMDSRIGHVDFYPNEGKAPQPGCKHMFCSHGRAMEFYETTIDDEDECSFDSEPCTWDENKTAGPYPKMGFGVSPTARGFYCLKTTAVKPFCIKDKGNSKNSVKP